MLEKKDPTHESRAYELAAETLSRRGADIGALVEQAGLLQIELPSWGMGRGGTRFGRYPEGEEARTVEEKIEDCALVHALTGATPAVATHFPWDGADLAEARQTLQLIRDHGLQPGAVNSNTFSPRPAAPSITACASEASPILSPTCAAQRSNITSTASKSCGCSDRKF